jgi:hypothetical protein
MKCPKCNGEMEEGLIADASYLSYQKQKWVTKLKFLGYSLENAHETITYRCKNCGFLENYAK